MIQGEDIKVRLTLTDGMNPVVPSTLESYAVNIYYKDNGGAKHVITTFKSTNTGLYGITVFNDAAGKIDVVVNRNVTKGIKGKIYAEVFVRLSAGSEYIGSKSVNGTNEIYLFEAATASLATVIA